MLSASFLLMTWIGSLGIAWQPEAVTVSRVTIREEVTFRVPIVRQRLLRPARWKESKGPKCIEADDVVAAVLAEEQTIDFLLRDRRRIRARMDDECPALDFYGSFYVQPRKGRICARRDEIRSRMGGACRIERFRLMTRDLP